MHTDHTNIAAAGTTSPSAILGRARARLSAFHKEEDGLSTVEMLLLLFVGVVILIALLKWVWPNVFDKITQLITDLLGLSENPGGGGTGS